MLLRKSRLLHNRVPAAVSAPELEWKCVKTKKKFVVIKIIFLYITFLSKWKLL